MRTSASIWSLYSRRFATGLGLLFVSLAPRAAVAQSPASGGFVVGSRQIWAMDPTSLSGGWPKDVTPLNRAAKVVTKDGVPMIKSTHRTNLLVQLPEVLPSAFTTHSRSSDRSANRSNGRFGRRTGENHQSVKRIS